MCYYPKSKKCRFLGGSGGSDQDVCSGWLCMIEIIYLLSLIILYLHFYDKGGQKICVSQTSCVCMAWMVCAVCCQSVRVGYVLCPFSLSAGYVLSVCQSRVCAVCFQSVRVGYVLSAFSLSKQGMCCLLSVCQRRVCAVCFHCVRVRHVLSAFSLAEHGMCCLLSVCQSSVCAVCFQSVKAGYVLPAFSLIRAWYVLSVLTFLVWCISDLLLNRHEVI